MTSGLGTSFEKKDNTTLSSDFKSDKEALRQEIQANKLDLDNLVLDLSKLARVEKIDLEGGKQIINTGLKILFEKTLLNGLTTEEYFSNIDSSVDAKIIQQQKERINIEVEKFVASIYSELEKQLGGKMDLIGSIKIRGGKIYINYKEGKSNIFGFEITDKGELGIKRIQEIKFDLSKLEQVQEISLKGGKEIINEGLKILFEKTLLDGKTLEEYLKEVDAKNTETIKLQLAQQIEKFASNVYIELENLLGENINSIVSIRIKGGRIFLTYKDGKSGVFSFAIKADKKGFYIKKFEELNPKTNEELVKEAEKERNLKLFTFFGGVLSIKFMHSGIKNIYDIKSVEFMDNEGKIHKFTIGKKIKGEKTLVLSETLKMIEETLGYKIKFEGEKVYFEMVDKTIELKNIREKVESLDFKDFKEAMKDSKIEESKLKEEFIKYKVNALNFVDGLNIQYGEKIKPMDFLRELSKKTVTSSMGMILHIIMHPIFFQEVHKKGQNLDSYFKSASEMALFMTGAQTSAKYLSKQALKLRKYGVPGKMAGGFLVLVGSMAGGMSGTVSGHIVAGVTGLQKKFDLIVPNNEDFFYKYAGWTNESLVSYLGFGGFAFEIADYFGIDIKVPGVDALTLWKSKVDFSTNKREYFSVGLTRTRESYNKKIDEFAGKILNGVTEKIKKYNEKVEKINIRYKRRSNYAKLLDEAKEDLNKDLRKIILKGGNKDVEIAKELYDGIMQMLPFLVNQKFERVELEAMIIDKVNTLKITEETLKNMEELFIGKKSLIEDVLEGKTNDKLTKSEAENHGRVMARVGKDVDFYNYYNSLSDNEKDYMKKYYYRTLNRKEILEENDYVYKNGKKVTMYHALMTDKSTITLENGKKIKRGDYFYNFVNSVKDIKEEKYFLERLRESDNLVDATSLKPKETLGGQKSQIEKYSKGIEIEYDGEKMFIGLDNNGQLEYIQYRNKKFKPSIKNSFDSTIAIFGKRKGHIISMFPYLYIDRNGNDIIFKRGKINEMNSGFMESTKWNIGDLFKSLREKSDFILSKNYELYNDLELKLDK